MARSLVRDLGMKTIEEVAHCAKLLVAEALAEQRADARNVVIRGRLELLSAGVGQLCVDDARVGLAGGLPDEAATLQSVERARDSRRREQHLLRQIDASHHAIGR